MPSTLNYFTDQKEAELHVLLNSEAAKSNHLARLLVANLRSALAECSDWTRRRIEWVICDQTQAQLSLQILNAIDDALGTDNSTGQEVTDGPKVEPDHRGEARARPEAGRGAEAGEEGAPEARSRR